MDRFEESLRGKNKFKYERRGLNRLNREEWG